MTAEVAIMNLQAVALAADSAVTVTSYPGGNQKIFSSANKLFALSEVAPVGILVYGRADFMSIPWETVVKEYRRFLGGKTFTKLNEYATDFCRFLSEEIAQHLSEQHQMSYAETLADLIFNEIKDEIRSRIDRKLSQFVEDSGDGIEDFTKNVERIRNEVTAEVVNEYHLRAKQSPLMKDVPEDFERTLNATLGKYLRNSRASIFGRALRPGLPRKLNHIALKAIGGFFDNITGDPSSGQTSGIVVSGFGDRDMFPAMVVLRVEGVVQNILKLHHEKKEIVLDHTTSSVIVPFAQTDMVYQFMEGISPDYLPYLKRSMVSHLTEYSNDLLRILKDELGVDTGHLEEKLKGYYPQLADYFVEEIKKVGAKYFWQPIVNVVSMLPKEQLAEMAESLVSLTALKRRVSSQEETVGGPTDVAVITKGDGLIWIKRKHYFAPEFNPSYFARASHRRTQYAQANTRFEEEASARGETPLG